MNMIKFCTQCQNMVYPEEQDQDQYLEENHKHKQMPMHKQKRSLVYVCRHCSHQEVIEDKVCVYRYDIDHSADVTPTLPRTKSVRCAQCNHREAMFYEATPGGEKSMTLFFICCNPNCGHRWRD